MAGRRRAFQGEPAGAGQRPSAPDRAAAPLDRRRLRLGLALAVSIGVVAAVVVLAATGGRDVLRAIAALPLSTIAAVLGLDLVSWAGESVVFAALAGRWTPRDLLRMTGVYVGGGFPALVTPFGSGGLPGWTWMLTRQGLSAGEAGAVVGARALLTSLFFVLAGGVAAALVPGAVGGSPAARLTGVLALLGVLAATVWVVARPEPVSRGLQRLLRSRAVSRIAGPARGARAADVAARETERFARGLRALVRERPWAVAAAFGGLVVSRAALFAMLPVILSGLGWRGEPLLAVASLVAVWAVASASPTPGGTGAADAAMAAALSSFAPAATAGAAALLWRGTTFYFDLVVGGAIFARAVGRSVAKQA